MDDEAPQPRPLVLDVDTGIDDMIALLIAATSPELTSRGVTCVAGNVEIHHVARNTGKILRMVGRGDVPVSIGAARPLQRRLRTAPDTHGPTGTGYVELRGEDRQLGTTEYTAIPASRYIGAHVSRHPGEMTDRRARARSPTWRPPRCTASTSTRGARRDLDGRHARGAREHDRDRRVERLRRSRGGRGLPCGPARSIASSRSTRRRTSSSRWRTSGAAGHAPGRRSSATRSASTSASTSRPMGSTARTCTIRSSLIGRSCDRTSSPGA